MTAFETRSQHRCFDGTQGFYQHVSTVIGLPMRFSVFQPPQTQNQRVPVLFFLAGLTCTEETFMIKAGAQRYAAEYGVMLVAMDTSPRQTGITGETDDWDFGAGAGFIWTQRKHRGRSFTAWKATLPWNYAKSSSINSQPMQIAWASSVIRWADMVQSPLHSVILIFFARSLLLHRFAHRCCVRGDKKLFVTIWEKINKIGGNTILPH